MLGGSNIGDLQRGIRRRYGRATGAAVYGFANLWRALKPGTAAAVQGSMKAFGPKHHLSRFDPGFDGGHAVFVARVDATDRVWWCDPEGPAKGYDGEFITKAQLKSFVTAFNGAPLVKEILPTAPPQEETMLDLVRYLPGWAADVKPRSNIRVAPIIKSTLIKTTGATAEPVTLIGTVKGDVDPANGKTEWFVWWDEKRYAYTATDNIRNARAPSTGDAELVATLTDELGKAKADLLAAQQEAAEAAEKERDRIALAEADRIRNT